MKSTLLLILLFIWAASHGQQIKVIHESNFKHNYAVGYSEYLEHQPDTIRNKYVATIKISSEANIYNLAELLELSKIKIKELGANAFFVYSSTVDENSISVIIKTYFMPDPYRPINAAKRVKNKIFVYSIFYEKDYFQSFYINDSLVSFDSHKSYTFTPIPGQKYYIRSCVSANLSPVQAGTRLVAPSTAYIKAKPDKIAGFILVYNNKAVQPKHLSENQRTLFSGCPTIMISYEAGRCLMEIIKPE